MHKSGVQHNEVLRIEARIKKCERRIAAGHNILEEKLRETRLKARLRELGVGA